MVSPRDVLLRLRAQGVGRLTLLESAGPITEYSRFSYLSAAPIATQCEMPERPSEQDFFPAWIGGLTYEREQIWHFYPSGLVWDRKLGTLSLVGQPHLDWESVLVAQEAQLVPLQIAEWSEDDLDFASGVKSVQELIRAGEVYQVNLSRGVKTWANGDPLDAYCRLAQLNPSPFMAYVELADETIVSCSPERLVFWEKDLISARPIAGTRKRGKTTLEDQDLEKELRGDPKEMAEHTMLVDLVRHDLGRVAQPGSVWIPDFGLVERYSHVMHLVSQIEGRAKPDLTVDQLLKTTFPGGTITGAPKQRVMQAIQDLEPEPRGWYTGSLGLISGKRVDFNILIRTIVFKRKGLGWQAQVRAGAGIVIDSDPQRETYETAYKAAALLEAIDFRELAGKAQPPAFPRPGRSWKAPDIENKFLDVRVVVLDNFDSFTFNLVHDLQALGATVLVLENTADLSEVLAASATHVLIGPGPGTPTTSGITLDLTRFCLERSIPLLGVCLGHQALGELLGGTVERAKQPKHGICEAMEHNGTGLFANIDKQAPFTRYHSLVVRKVPTNVKVTATAMDGEIMAIEALEKPAWGVQFHPESVLSCSGRVLLSNWLKLGQEWK